MQAGATPTSFSLKSMLASLTPRVPWAASAAPVPTHSPVCQGGTADVGSAPQSPSAMRQSTPFADWIGGQDEMDLEISMLDMMDDEKHLLMQEQSSALQAHSTRAPSTASFLSAQAGSGASAALLPAAAGTMPASVLVVSKSRGQKATYDTAKGLVVLKGGVEMGLQVGGEGGTCCIAR
jgi:hypothetical protein